MEHWRPVPGWEGYYEVSDLGRVRSVTRMTRGRFGPTRYQGRFLKSSWRGRKGGNYLGVQFTRLDERKYFYVHSLVLLAFVGPKPDGFECCHGPAGKQI